MDGLVINLSTPAVAVHAADGALASPHIARVLVQYAPEGPKEGRFAPPVGVAPKRRFVCFG
jgi:hypothetical protein